MEEERNGKKEKNESQEKRERKQRTKRNCGEEDWNEELKWRNSWKDNEEIKCGEEDLVDIDANFSHKSAEASGG